MIFIIELNKTYNTDCVIGMKNIPNDFIDLTVTSPPYGSIRKYDGYTFDFDEISKEIYRVTKKGGILVWVVGDQTINGSETGESFRQALRFMELKFRLHDTMIYEKNTSSFPARRNGNRYTQIYEYMFIFSKGKPKVANLICDKPNKWSGHTNWGKNTQRDKNNDLKQTPKIKPVPDFSPRNNIWRYVVGGGFSTKDKIAHKHPAIFPEKLAEDHILTWSKEGDVVMDPLAGSGTTLKMAKLNNRKYIGFEISKGYCEIIEERLKTS
ncbi:site-specific DNA-methyltransferase [Clostridioides difficile]|nr:site-specific DNA-methyltransferase [Clostridioides difficile]